MYHHLDKFYVLNIYSCAEPGQKKKSLEYLANNDKL